MTHAQERFDPSFLEQFRAAGDGDTALMQAIRRGREAAVASLLADPATDLTGRNGAGETALYLALRIGRYDWAEALRRLGAPDAGTIVNPRRPSPPRPSASLDGGPLSDGMRAELAVTQPGEAMRALDFDELTRVRARVAELVEEVHPRSRWQSALPPEQEATAGAWLGTLRETGLAEIGAALNPAQIGAIRGYFDAQGAYAGHFFGATDGIPRGLADIERRGGQACYSPDTIFHAPYLLELANHPVILRTVSEYLGCTPTIYNANVIWSFPHDRPPVIYTTESLHRDYDHWHFVILFIYLSDVDTGTGAHRYYRRTHDRSQTEDALGGRFSPGLAEFVARDLYRSAADGHGRIGLVEELLREQIRDITGPAGTAFLADTYGLHRALPPRRAPRLMAWFRYGAAVDGWRADNTGSAAGHDRYINRLLPIMQAQMEGRIAAEAGPSLQLIIDGYDDTSYNICQCGEDFYAVHQSEGPTGIKDIDAGRTNRPIYKGRSVQDIIRLIEAARGRISA